MLSIQHTLSFLIFLLNILLSLNFWSLIFLLPVLLWDLRSVRALTVWCSSRSWFYNLSTTTIKLRPRPLWLSLLLVHQRPLRRFQVRSWTTINVPPPPPDEIVLGKVDTRTKHTKRYRHKTKCYFSVFFCSNRWSVLQGDDTTEKFENTLWPGQGTWTSSGVRRRHLVHSVARYSPRRRPRSLS